MQTRKEARMQSNINQLQIALDNGWVKYDRLDTNIIQFRMKGKPRIDFMLLENRFTNIDTKQVRKSNMKQFLKWYRRRSI